MTLVTSRTLPGGPNMARMLAVPTAVARHHILVVDDHDLVRLGLRSLVQTHAASRSRPLTVLEARTLQEALTQFRTHSERIGLVLLDLHLPDAHGLSGLTDFLAQFPQARVVVLSGASDPALMRQALTRGAQAFLPKSGDLQHVIGYIRSVGLFGPESAVMPSPVPPLAATPGGLTPEAGLTERQQQVLDGILAGRSNREIAEQAHLSEGTVKNHVSALLLHFGVRSRAQLISTLR